MATRRDELNAYSFARKRTVAAFLQPSPHGSEEAAPRPLKTVAPSLVVALLIVVAFGFWGILKPSAPTGWNKPAEKVIVGDESTTRYVVLKTNGEAQLHPVLNLASARLLLDPQKFAVIKVKESVLDNSGMTLGTTIGIPYAPDRLPSADDAGKAKTWALCESPGGGVNAASQRAVFVINQQKPKEAALVGGRNRLRADEALYIEVPGGAQYLVTDRGNAFLLGGPDGKQDPATVNLLRQVIFDASAQPQKVDAAFLSTLGGGHGAVYFPPVADIGAPSAAPGLNPEHAKVGLVLKANNDQYVVQKDRVVRVTDFVAKLLLNSPQAASLYSGSPEPASVGIGEVASAQASETYLDDLGWPEKAVTQANTQDEKTGRRVACSVYSGTDDKLTKQPAMTMWAGLKFPRDVAQSGTNTYVSPGSGLFYRAYDGTDKRIGSIYLVTDTGLRYSVPTTGDSDAGGAAKQDEQVGVVQTKLGYGKNSPVPVPKIWSDLLATGPTLDEGAAKQAQGS
ncbi:type VII secretion protein EccB [Streptomyces sp. NPDC058691]|uniref:type VII secretion protein EccB n=1 Tax=Streptomyces sp. NPDC058691 TaxID=3346601 RepID=UPI003648CD97